MKRTPLPSHDWGDPLPNGDRPCETDGCSTVWVSVYSDPPPWPCKRSSSLDRSTPLSPVSDTNSGREHQKDMQYRQYVRDLPCVVCHSPPPNDPHHVATWGSGHGDWLDDGSGNLASLCRKHHRELDSPGSGPETFQDEHGIDLQAKAREIGEAYQKQSEQMREDKDGL